MSSLKAALSGYDMGSKLLLKHDTNNIPNHLCVYMLDVPESIFFYLSWKFYTSILCIPQEKNQKQERKKLYRNRIRKI